MNSYALIILAALIGSYILELVSDLLNIKRLTPLIPEEFADTYDRETYEKSQTYTKVNTRFGIVSASFDLIVFLSFWFLGGFNYLDMAVREPGYGPIWTGLIFTAVLIILKTLLSLPFSIYSIFVIEERFGFNKTTPKTFLLDLIKGILLGIVLGGPLLAAVLAIFQYAGAHAWLYCWIAVTAFTMIVQFIAPVWIMPLFNRFTPLEEGELREAIMNYAESVKFSIKNLFVIDGSRRSGKSNAFFTGFGKNKRIALFDTLVEKHTVAELVAILAHEIGHYKKRHILKGMVISILHTGFMLFLLSIFISHDGLFRAFYMENSSVYSGLVFFGLLFSPVEVILSIFMNILSRKNEYEADRFAAETTGKPGDMVAALKKLSVDNLSNLTPHPFYVFIHYSHPPLMERIKAIRAPAA